MSSGNRASQDEASAGYEGMALEFMRGRHPSIGVATVLEWAGSLPPGEAILDLACGHGAPISTALMEAGFVVYGIDASPTLVEAFRQRLPRAHVVCERVEDSRFFDRTFYGVIAVGLMFLLPPDSQRDLIRKVATRLKRGGSFLFTAPSRSCTWSDRLTGRESLSLGAEEYSSLVAEAGLRLVGEYDDEGENHYFEARRL